VVHRAHGVIATVAAGALKAGRHVECFETERSGRRRQTDDLTAEAEGRRRTKHAPKARHQLLTIAPGVAGVKRRPVSPGTATAQAPANQSQRAQGSCSSTFLTDSFFWDASRMRRHGKHDSHVRCPDFFQRRLYRSTRAAWSKAQRR